MHVPRPSTFSRIRGRYSAARDLAASEAALALSRNIDRRLCDAALLGAMRVHGPYTDVEEFRSRVLAVAQRRLARARGKTPPAAAADPELWPFLPRHLADLHLAQACARHPREDVAWRRMLELHFEPLRRCAAGFGAGESEVNELFADLWFTREPGDSLLAGYAGLAPLGAWLQLVLRRRLARRREREVAWRELTREVPTPALEPPERAAREEFLQALAGSLQRSLEALGERDRDFVVARLFRRENGVAIARRHGVSPSYVSRRSQEVLARLRERLQSVLVRFGIDVESMS